MPTSAREPTVQACPFSRLFRRRTARGDVGIAPYEKYAEYGFLFAKGIRNHFLSRKMCGFSAP